MGIYIKLWGHVSHDYHVCVKAIYFQTNTMNRHKYIHSLGTLSIGLPYSSKYVWNWGVKVTQTFSQQVGETKGEAWEFDQGKSQCPPFLPLPLLIQRSTELVSPSSCAPLLSNKTVSILPLGWEIAPEKKFQKSWQKLGAQTCLDPQKPRFW